MTSLVAGTLCCPVLTLLRPSHLAELAVGRRPLGRIRWEEQRRVGELPGVTEWEG